MKKIADAKLVLIQIVGRRSISALLRSFPEQAMWIRERQAKTALRIAEASARGGLVEGDGPPSDKTE